MTEEVITYDRLVNRPKPGKTPFVAYLVPGPRAVTAVLRCADVEGDEELCSLIDRDYACAEGLCVLWAGRSFALVERGRIVGVDGFDFVADLAEGKLCTQYSCIPLKRGYTPRGRASPGIGAALERLLVAASLLRRTASTSEECAHRSAAH